MRNNVHAGPMTGSAPADVPGQAVGRESAWRDPRREVIRFEVQGSRLWGTLDLPPAGRGIRPIGVVMLNSDDGCRLGPHRLWVRLAAHLCAKGFACLRFDYRGCGDSEGPEGPPPGDVGLTDALAAERVIRRRVGVTATVLVGICYGAEIALLAGRCRETVRGVVACSAGRYVVAAGYGRALRNAHGYVARYVRKLRQGSTWRKLVRGHVDVHTILRGLWSNVSPATWRRDYFGAAGATAIARHHHHRVPSLFIYGSADPLYVRCAPGYRREAIEQELQRTFICIEGADHNFSRAAWSQQVISAVEGFVCRTEASERGKGHA